MHSVSSATRTRSWAAALVALLLLGVVLTVPAGASDHKTFTANVAPRTAGAGQPVAFTVTLANTASQQQLGSVDIGVPGAFSDIAAPEVHGPGSATVSGKTIRLRDLSLPPGTLVDVSFSATTPCETAAYELTFVGKQANNFRGPPGNDFTLAGPVEGRTVTVTGGCGTLAFVTEPAHTERGAVITGTIGDPVATGVQVAVVDHDGDVLPVDIEVTIGLGDDPSNGVAALTGTLRRRTGVSGVATFGDLRIDTLGKDYSLTASSPGFSEVGSGVFGIWEDIAVCADGATCTTSASRARQMQVQVTGAGEQGSAMLLSILDQEIDCAESWQGSGPYPYNHAPATSLYEPVGNFDGVLTVAQRIDRSVVRQVPNDGAAFYQLCFLGEKPFVDRDGVTAQANPQFGGLFGPALLPDCDAQGRVPSPCVVSRTKAPGGDMLLVFTIPAEDPMFR